MMGLFDYPSFEKWYSILGWILDRVEKKKKNARFSIGARTADTALDILDRLVDCIYTKKRQYILREINMFLEKLRVLLRLAHDRHYISTRQYGFIARELDSFGSMIGGWLRSEARKKHL